jgi:coenzyme PQQ biosynthesis protein PqqD
MTVSVKIEETTVLRRNPDAAFRTYEGEGVVLMPSGAEVHVLNEVASRVWDLLDGERDVAAIVEALVAEFEVGREEASRDVREFLAALVEKEMVHPAV